MSTVAKYLCTIKLIDDTLYPGIDKGAPESLSATVFARTSAELPQATKIGSILRIHRGETKKHDDEMQLNCDVNIKAAWALFDPTEATTAVAHTGRRYTFVSKDHQRLKDIREFAQGYFSKNEVPCVTLKDAEKKPRDFDTLCLVLEIKKKGDNERIRMCDIGKVVKLNIAFSRNPYISPQDIVRIRSANYADKKDFKTLILNEYSNLLRIPREYMSAQNLLDAIEKQHVEEKVKAQLALYTPQVGAPLILGEIKDMHRGKKVSQLRELFSGGAVKGAQRFFRVRASIIEVGPKDPHEWFFVTNKKTHEQYSSRGEFVGARSRTHSATAPPSWVPTWNTTTRRSSSSRTSLSSTTPTSTSCSCAR